ALISPGLRDVLFPLNQSYDMLRCFKLAGRDARLVAVADGHLMPSAQWSPGLPIWHAQKSVQCNGQTLRTQALIRDWLDGKLREDEKALARVPSFCVSGDATADARIQLGTWQPLQKVHLGSGLAGQVEWLMRPLDHVGNWFRPTHLPANWERPKNGWLRPARVPLFAADEATHIVGIPRIQLAFSNTDREDPVLYLRLAKWRPGSSSYQVLNQQVMPVHAKGPLEFELGGVNAVIEKGEVLGLLVTGWNNQFRFAGSGYGTDASIEGRIALPLVTPRGRLAGGSFLPPPTVAPATDQAPPAVDVEPAPEQEATTPAVTPLDIKALMQAPATVSDDDAEARRVQEEAEAEMNAAMEAGR
ncbi:MAG: hypothetical protein ACK4UT_01810, partial [Moraxellaceae bacterium]